MEKSCTVCGKLFIINKSPSLCKRETCSEICRLTLVSNKLSGKLIKNKQNSKNPDKWENIVCKNCGKEFASLILYHKKFCCNLCKIQWLKENSFGENNPNWKDKSLKVEYTGVKKSIRSKFLREVGICQKCGSDEHLQVHHKNRDRSDNSDSNLILLCKSCHANEHTLRGEKYIARFILAHPQTKDRTPKPNKICATCNKEFKPLNKSQKYCSCACKAVSRVKPRLFSICPSCGNTFYGKRPKQKYCSVKCRDERFK